MKVFVLLVLAVSQISGYTTRYDPRQDLTKVFDIASSLEAGVATARAEGKPILVIIHLTTCPACKRLLPELVGSQELKELGKQFSIINIVDGSEPAGDDIAPDGKRYFPRLVYFNSNAQCLPQVTNPNQPKYPYYYEKAGEVAKSMRNALALNGNIQY